MEILFMGTPDFAKEILEELNKHYKIKGVLTQPDKPKGRGKKLTAPPVKIIAEKIGINVFQHETLKNLSFLEELKTLNPNFIIVVAYGKILPEYILNFCPCINIHASLLPKYRGAAPIERAIMNNETKTGITTMLMDKGLDTGDILLSEETPISDLDTTKTLRDKLIEISKRLILKTIEDFDNIIPRKQNDRESTYANLLTKKDFLIDFNEPTQKIYRQIQAGNPENFAFTYYEEKMIKIIKANKVLYEGTEINGTILRSDNTIIIKTSDGALEVLEVQAENGKSMPIKSYLNGHVMKLGTVCRC